MSTSSSTQLIPTKSKRILELDALRALAALNLLLFHFTWVYQQKWGFASPLGFTFPYGKYGVQLFFMLSGFVNAMTLLKRREPGDFVAGRMIRVLPSFWLVVVLNVWLLTLLPMFGESVSGASTLANLTVMPNLFGVDCMEPVTWTLQVEILFYGFLLLLLLSKAFDRLLPVLLGVLAVCLFGSLSVAWYQQQYAETFWASRFAFLEDLFILRYLPLFAMGMLLNEIKSKRGNMWLNAIGILLSAVVFHTIDQASHNPLATILLFGLLAMSAYGKVPLLRIKPLMFISTISYSLYLFHNHLGSAFMRQLESWGCSPLAAIVMATAFSIGVAAAITFWLEQPVTRCLRDQWIQFKKYRTAGRANDSLQPNCVLQPQTDPLTK